MLFIFSTPELIRNMWQLKTAVFLHWCLIWAVPLFYNAQGAKVSTATPVKVEQKTLLWGALASTVSPEPIIWVEI